MSAHAPLISRGGPYGRAMGTAVAARDAAFVRCRDARLRKLARILDDIEGCFWNRGDDAGKLVAIAVMLASTLALEARRLTTEQLESACKTFVQAIAAAEQDAAGYRRQQYRELLKAYRGLYHDVDAQCTDVTRRLEVSALLRGIALGQSLTQNSERLDIERLKLATAVLRGEAV
ncbi:hypothetical protein [Burkholderia pseudomallei]|uniref:hypothetical protein n=1 Tax=Burkholderia pseudomallei TaxID=28450 RepID=UPI0008FF18FC|nr:hypothetical protein [Burkholderia pseudomallei]APD36563.1 hypothetical protein BK015_16425 [Burkholderia pseudomallei]ARK39943.1 hypothetical protein BOC60_06735 [Burkholderia pseudomallei]ARL36078.1 hypothetical protein BOC49_07245 [Burkholderia pseudomallei]ARL58632.1 hypothetical protein BOC52_18715 [Burkholderia pseudomallei]ARL68599.1 hypothetical protein BOC53_36620 [Burkholderia pseudomallei]